MMNNVLLIKTLIKTIILKVSATGKAPVRCDKISQQNKYKFKAIMIIFFGITQIVHMDWVPDSQTINDIYFKEVLTSLCELMRK